MKVKKLFDHIEWWALKCKQDMRNCQRQLTPFINAQIENANLFYQRLAKTKNGKQKIRELKLKPIG
ncbi:MAG: hypothetical protein Q7K34_01645 [archaeon]|nr:hypothetical protein [archaeon]